MKVVFDESGFFMNFLFMELFLELDGSTYFLEEAQESSQLRPLSMVRWTSCSASIEPYVPHNATPSASS